MSEETESQSLEERTVDLRDSHLVCRDLGHSWKQESLTKSSGGLYLRLARCRSCRTVRKDRITRTGTIYGRSYDYASGYQLEGFGHEVRDRSTFRRAVLQRAGVLVP